MPTPMKRRKRTAPPHDGRGDNPCSRRCPGCAYERDEIARLERQAHIVRGTGTEAPR